MGQIKILHNVIQHYTWGSCTAIPELLNLPSADDTPCAELWMGAHPSGPSLIIDQGQAVSLEKYIRQRPEAVLGAPVAGKFGNTLPFLFKVLAAAGPLSIQAHPDRLRAEEGYSRETRNGIALRDPRRNYKDPNHKPECLCALTPFSLLCGFRNPSDIIRNFDAVGAAADRRLTVDLENNPGGSGLKAFFHRLLVMKPDSVHDVLARAVDGAARRVESDPMYGWVIRLHQCFPGDIMALVPLFLNLMKLLPRQAIFLPNGVLHSYLDGVGLELMANSDNVLRGGLTAKHIDVDELMKVVDFSIMTPRLLAHESRQGRERVYETMADEFVLSEIQIEPDHICRPQHQGRVAILLCIQGSALVTEECGRESTSLNRGDSVLIPASAGPYTLTGDAVIYKVGIPLPPEAG